MGTAVCGSNISGTTVNANHTVGNAAPVSASLAILMLFFMHEKRPKSYYDMPRLDKRAPMILHLGPDTNVVRIVAFLLPCHIDVYGSHVNTLLCSHGQENW